MANKTLRLDLLIMDTHNSYTMAVGDASLYPANLTPNSPTLEITVPGYPAISMPFQPQSVQVYSSESLGITCEDCCTMILPDGVYKFKYSITPAYERFVEKNYLRTDNIYEKLDKAWLKTDFLQCDQELKRKNKLVLDEIEDYITGAIAAANQCALKLASELYQKADKLLDAYISNYSY